MRFQKTEYNCGPAALSNALRVLGIKAGQAHLAKLAGTTEADGTDENGLVAALVNYRGRISYEEIYGMAELYCFTVNHGPVILCIENWLHWVTVVGVVGDRFTVFDPERSPSIISENGIRVLSWRKLAKLWKASRRTAASEPPYYGLGVCLERGAK